MPSPGAIPLLRRILPVSMAVGAGLVPSAHGQPSNPIARVARLFDSKLVHVEDRVYWLERKLDALSRPSEHTLQAGLGHQGGRKDPRSAPSTVVLDLGKSYPIDAVFLVPAQRESTEDPGIFPRRLQLECSQSEDFSDSVLIHRTPDGTSEDSPGAAPAAFFTGVNGRFVRLTVLEGSNRGGIDLFGLSEIAVISNSLPVSFGAKVTATNSLTVPGIWYPEALVDGRTPLGTWQNGPPNPPSTGDAVNLGSGDPTTVWTVALASPSMVKRVILFPYEVSRSFGCFIFPDSLRVSLVRNGTVVKSAEWSNPTPGGSHRTPLLVPFEETEADSVRVEAIRPWQMDNRKVHALSEIEVWSESENLCRTGHIERSTACGMIPVPSLHDGYTSVRRIIPVGAWLRQLNERYLIEKELESLRPLHRSIEARSELNATWGSAILLGLTFLVPVFVVERRRLMSKEQLNLLRKRIASDLHDDIGSNLGSISLIARTARKDLARLEGPQEVARDLDEMENIARESSLAMRDIVWLLERKQDSIGDLFQRMRETANRLLREIEFTIDCEATKTSSRISLDAKRHLFLFYKEAIHNVLKHSKATSVRIRFSDEGDKLVIEVCDNGIGIATGPGGSHTTVNKLDDRARVLGGHLNIISSPQTGTCVRLVVRRANLSLQHSHP